MVSSSAELRTCLVAEATQKMFLMFVFLNVILPLILW